jgi:hypothetical protein
MPGFSIALFRYFNLDTWIVGSRSRKDKLSTAEVLPLHLRKFPFAAAGVPLIKKSLPFTVYLNGTKDIITFCAVY